MGLLAVLVLAGCTGEESTTPTAPLPTAPTTASIPVPASVLALTRAGDAPRTVLDRSAAQDQDVTLSTAATIRQQVGTEPERDLSGPEVSVPLAASVTEAGVALELGTPTSEQEALSAALAPAEGSGATLVGGPDGPVTELQISPATELGDEARAAVEQALRQGVQYLPLLPAEPVGVGAQWTITQELVSLGLALTQVSTVTLADVEGDALTLDVEVTQTPLSDTWELPDGAGTLAVDAYPVAGSGTLRVALTAPLPVGGELTVGGDQRFSDPESGLVLAQTVRTTVRWG